MENMRIMPLLKRVVCYLHKTTSIELDWLFIFPLNSPTSWSLNGCVVVLLNTACETRCKQNMLYFQQFFSSLSFTVIYQYICHLPIIISMITEKSMSMFKKPKKYDVFVPLQTSTQNDKAWNSTFFVNFVSRLNWNIVGQECENIYWKCRKNFRYPSFVCYMP